MLSFKKNYSKYYDILYTDKNYKDESQIIKKIIKKYSYKPINLLDIGCGTGEYSKLLTSNNLNVTGLDKSSYMIKKAKKKFKNYNNLKFIKGDLLKYKSNIKFDIISALFHILSYQIKNSQIDKFFKNSANVLNKKGIFVFDFWFKPGVMNLKQPNKFRKINKKNLKIIRLTNSIWFRKKNRIDDIHELFIFKKKNLIENFQETHQMRYFDLSFIKKKLSKHKLKFLTCLDLNTKNFPTKKSWGALVIAQKN
tara:strand:+ start:140 stop:895 length:756 start_codon:yes stop_codon:yes gene_type:complete